MYIPVIILAVFGILFILSKGFFRAAAGFIISKINRDLPFGEKAFSRSLAALFISALLSFLFMLSCRMNDTVSDGYLLRDGYGIPGRTEDLNVSLGDDTYPVDIEVKERIYTEEEVESILSEACARLTEIMKTDFDTSRIDDDLPLDTILSDMPVRVSFITYSPDILDWDGSIGEKVPEDGADVRLDAVISLQGREETVSFDLKVFPKVLPPGEDAVRKIKDRIEEENPETEEKIVLPSEIDGNTLTWSSVTDRTGYLILLSGLIASLLIPAAGIKAGDDELKRKRESMMTDYPNIIDKLVLLLNAGLSTRLAVKRIALDYRKNSGPGGKVKWGYEEICRTYTEMEMGISERDAYINMGKRAPVPKYKALSTLLVQNLLRGSRELIGILEEEADNAFEDRKKRARIAGEKAGTKLLFPMLIMLGIVLVILTVPAFMNFL